MQSIDDPDEIKATTNKILSDDLKSNVNLALNSVLSVRKDGKQYYNTIKYHGAAALDDVQLIQVSEYMQCIRIQEIISFILSLFVGLVYK